MEPITVETITRLRKIADALESGLMRPTHLVIESVTPLQRKCTVEMRGGGFGNLSLVWWQYECPQ